MPLQHLLQRSGRRAVRLLHLFYQPSLNTSRFICMARRRRLYHLIILREWGLAAQEAFTLCYNYFILYLLVYDIRNVDPSSYRRRGRATASRHSELLARLASFSFHRYLWPITHHGPMIPIRKI